MVDTVRLYTEDISPSGAIYGAEWLSVFRQELKSVMAQATEVIIQKLLEDKAGNRPSVITVRIDAVDWVHNSKLRLEIECSEERKKWPWCLPLADAQKATFNKEP